MEHNLIFYNHSNAKFNQLSVHLQPYVFYKVSLYDFQECPKGSHYRLWHPAKESRTQPVSMARHIKMSNLDGLGLRLQFLVVLK